MKFKKKKNQPKNIIKQNLSFWPNLLLVLILLLAAFLRLWNLAHYPSGLNADEAAIGYNAYSLLETGKDEHGDPWPIHFKSFGDYKPGLYFYLVLPLVKLLGLNIWAVRLPAALLGILSVLLIMLLTKEIFREKFLANRFSLWAGFFLAISPWHLHFTRGGWESGSALFLMLLAVWLFFKGLSKPGFFVSSVLVFCLSMYTYHSARLVVPLLFLGLMIFYRQKIFFKKNLKIIVIAVLVGLLFLAPLVKDFLGPAGVSRFSGVGLFSDEGPFWRTNELRGQHPNPYTPEVRLLHNRLFAYGLAFVENWLDHFNGNFLFVAGDVIERSRVPETGQMYLFDILFLFFGFYFLLLKRPPHWRFVLLWLVVAPVAAAMTFQTPHALRANNMIVPLLLLSSYGIVHLIDWFVNKKKTLKIILTIFLFLVIPWNLARYLHEYYVHYAQTYPGAWEQGFEQLVWEVRNIEDEYEKVYVTDRYDQPYILFLFYLKYPPEKFQKEVKLTPRDEFGFSTVRDFDNFHFEKINWEELKTKSNILVVGTPQEINTSATILKRIYFQNGEVAFLIVQV
ncbi:glycosyltransferase family 39 protein [Candidatus Shapirobacteria bacterium]|nr:glycosyltransferase family 39 protein [Candidatus Shapirobacteria bacterium]